MKNNTTEKATRPLKPNLETEPKKTNDGPLIEIEIPEPPNPLERPSIEQRKEDASKPLYLTRYE